MAREIVYHEWWDGSITEAVVENGKVVDCPVIRICPPYGPHDGTLSLDEAIEFLVRIKQAVEKTSKGGKDVLVSS